jgi:hypothetical protein
MPPNDQEPRYRLVDSNGNVVGSLFVNGDGNVAIQDETATETEFTPNGVTTPSVETDAVRTETIGAGEHLYAGDFDGVDADARLDNAIAAADGEDVVYLERASYGANRTISTRLNFRGDFSGTELQDATWTINASQASLFGAQLRGTVEIIVDQPRVHLDRIYDLGNGIAINANHAIVTRCFAATITFASGTEDGVADTNTLSTITDNGSNVVGDNS